MGQNIHAGGAGQTLGLAHHIVCINNGHVGQKLIVSQRILDAALLIGDNRKGRHLGARTGGGGHCHKVSLLSHLGEGVDSLADVDEPHSHIHEICFRMLVEHPHNLARVHGGAAAHGDNHIGLKLPHKLSAGLRIGQGGIGLHIGEYSVGDAHLVQTVGNHMGISVLVQEGIGNDKGSLLAHHVLQLF